ncbi:ABC transporter permease [Nonomuraea sp. SYSU D8015]|uniref:ABC transporter permease n=1 Tax=Nonomuraea sp. SYSU D8015 TaxID=2593644 RepID=UPI00166138C8|nr:ABC transporter permease [Nonomuraea sp. SYSU D8015]
MTVRTVEAPVLPRGLRRDLRVIKVVLQRDLIRFVYDVSRALAMFLQAVLWLFVMGGGFGGLMPADSGGIRLETVMFPGVVAMTVIVTSISSASSVVWDREFGFLREMLVAPVGRTSIVIGKVLSGTVLATMQGAVLLALAGLAGVPYDLVLMAELLGLMLLAAFSLSAFGIMIASRVKGLEAYLGVSQLAVMPLVFLSGALFPTGTLPGWLSALSLVNPLSYTVDPMRQALFAHVDAPESVQLMFNPGISWYGWTVPVALEIALVAGSGLVFLYLAVARLRKID